MQKVTSPEITSRSQLYFSSKPRKAEKPGGWPQDQLQWLTTPCSGTDQSVEIVTLEGHTWRTDEYSAETLSWELQDSHPQERDKNLKHRTQLTGSFWGAASAISLLFPPQAFIF